MKKFQIIAAMNIRVDASDVTDGDVLAEFNSDHNLHQLAQMIRMGQAKLATVDAADGGNVDDANKPIDLYAMTVKQLREFAASRSIDLGVANKKDEIIAAIQTVTGVVPAS